MKVERKQVFSRVSFLICTAAEDGEQYRDGYTCKFCVLYRHQSCGFRQKERVPHCILGGLQLLLQLGVGEGQLLALGLQLVELA